MRRAALAVVSVLALLSGASPATAREASPAVARAIASTTAPSDIQQTIRQRIEELGDEQYSVRRRAEEELIRFGPEAFDQLKAAEESADLEIAERARYIVQRMRVDWVRPEDAPEVRRLLARYGEVAEGEKEKRIARLNALEGGAGLPALCRIARLETSPLVARRAALAILDRQPPADGRVTLGQQCQQELGASQRPPVVWIQLWLHELSDRRATLEEWNTAVEAEAALLKEASPETNFDVLHVLMERRLELCHKLGLVDETTTALMRIVVLIGEELPYELLQESFAFRRMMVQWGEGRPDLGILSIGWAMRWIIEHKRWDVLDQVERQRGKQIQNDRRLLYHLAAARSGAGRGDEGAELADKAFEMKAKLPAERAEDADALAELGFIDWASREYERALEELPVVSYTSLEARANWAIWLHDRQQYKQAADVLGELFDAMREDRAAQRKLLEEVEGRRDLGALAARREYYLACYYESRQEYDLEREALERGWRRSKDDPDLLISMYHSPGSSDEYRQETLERIRQTAQRHLELIEEYPQVAELYNQRAWLISNTEGDFAQAVEHSKRSLELEPDNPSYLDTLGRCYYAAGDLENAIKSQRRAVELAPQYEIMQRQLKQFEEALAAKRE